MNSPAVAPVDLTPAQLLTDIAAEYRTCEFATMTRSGIPVAWPAVCLIAPEGDRITLTTSVAFPVKAFNVRRDPRVALLFSDPTGTGRDDLPQVLVQGTATCPDEIRTSPAGLEDYWLRLWERQPGSMPTSGALARIMDAYYLRLVLTVTPQVVRTLPALRREPAPALPAPARRDRSPWAETLRRATGYDDAVLATAPAGGAPELVRVHVAADTEQHVLRLRAVAGGRLPAPGGRANLLGHRHDDRLDTLRQFGVVGTLVPDHEGRSPGAGLALRPERVLPAPIPGSPVDLVRTVRRMRRSSGDYLAARGLPRPVVAWQEFDDLKHRQAPPEPG